MIEKDLSRQLRTRNASNIRARYDLTVIQALRRLYRDVHLVDVAERGLGWMDELSRLHPNVIFNLICSVDPIEVSIAGCLEALRIPYTGSGPTGIAFAYDKVRSRYLLRGAGIRVPQFVELAPHVPIKIAFAPPFIVKPVSLGGCQGIYSDSIATTRKQALRLARRIWARFGVSAVCEEFVVGRELRVGVIETQAGIRIVGITEWRFRSVDWGWGFKTEAIVCNRTVRLARRVSRGPANIPTRLKKELTRIASTAMKALDMHDYATLDFRVDKLGCPVLLEVNVNPGLWSGSSIWKKPSFESNIRAIVNSALVRAQNATM